jgi:hypothetical protein
MISRRFPAAVAALFATAGLLSCSRQEQAVPQAPPSQAESAPAPTAPPGAKGNTVVSGEPTPGGAPALGSITFSKQVKADHSPVEAVTTFAPADTVIVSYYLADARPENVVKVRWIAPSGAVLNETSSTLGREGDGWGEFRIHRTPGLDPGVYKVELYLDETKAGEGSFTVDAAPAPTPTPSA